MVRLVGVMAIEVIVQSSSRRSYEVHGQLSSKHHTPAAMGRRARWLAGRVPALIFTA